MKRLCGVSFLTFVFVSGCANIMEIEGVVEDVRITTSISHKSEGEVGPVGGAVVGAIIAGAPGAVVGAALGSKDGEVYVKELSGCRLAVRTEKENLVVVFALDKYNPALTKCSLQRLGDKVKITKRSILGDPFEYIWGNTYGEVFP